jgi:hypothetical protein
VNYEFCPRCMSSAFPKVGLGCAFCDRTIVRHTQFKVGLAGVDPKADFRTVQLTPVAEPNKDAAT